MNRLNRIPGAPAVYTRRQFLPFAGAALTAAAGLRCTGDGSVSQAPTEVAPVLTPSPGNGEPERGGTLRVLVREGATGLDVHRLPASMQVYAWQWAGNFLVRQRGDSPFSPEPDLAVSLPELPGDGSTVTFKLNPRATFHQRPPANGRAVTATDVKATFDRIRALGARSARASLYGFVDSVQAIDPATVQFKLKGPRADLLAILSDQFDIILPAEIALRGEDAMVSAADVVGSGPYEAEAFDAMRARMTRRRDGYWGNNAGFLDACNIILQPDDASRANALLDRTADIATLPAVLAQLFKGRPDFAVTTAPLTSRHVLFVNHTAVRYRDLRVRQAVSRALDRVAFYGPYGTGVAGGPMSPAAVTWAVPESDLRTLPGYRDRETDRKDAASLLGAAGTLPDGFEDTLLTSAAEGLPELASRMAVDLAEAGIHLRVVELGGDYRELQTRLAAGDFTLALGVAVAGPYPDAQLYAYHHSRSGGANYGKYINAALDAKLDRQRILLDANERVRLVQEIQKEIITNPGPAWIGSPLEWRVAGPHAGGARAHPFLAGYDDAERLSFRP